MKILVLLIAVALTSVVTMSIKGCGTIGMVHDEAVKAVTVYCGLFSEEERAIFRRQVNQGSPHKITIKCFGE